MPPRKRDLIILLFRVLCPQMVTSLEREVAICRALRHPHIVGYLAAEVRTLVYFPRKQLEPFPSPLTVRRAKRTQGPARARLALSAPGILDPDFYLLSPVLRFQVDTSAVGEDPSVYVFLEYVPGGSISKMLSQARAV